MPFFLALQAMCFYLPYGLVWKTLSSKGAHRCILWMMQLISNFQWVDISTNRRHRLPLCNCTGGVDVSTLIQTAKSCLILALNIHQKPYDSDLTRERNTNQRLTDSSNGKPLEILEWTKFKWEEMKVLAAIVSGHSSFAEGRRRLRQDVQSRSLLASIRSTAGLSYLFLCYMGVKLLYLVNGVLPTRSALASADHDIQSYVYYEMQLLFVWMQRWSSWGSWTWCSARRLRATRCSASSCWRISCVAATGGSLACFRKSSTATSTSAFSPTRSATLSNAYAHATCAIKLCAMKHESYHEL